MVLPFGLRLAPFLFDEFSSAVEWIIQTKLHIPKVIHIEYMYSSQLNTCKFLQLYQKYM